jgi:hypothetical protein
MRAGTSRTRIAPFREHELEHKHAYARAHTCTFPITAYGVEHRPYPQCRDAGVVGRSPDSRAKRVSERQPMQILQYEM